MVKFAASVLVVAMVAHLIRPFGLPGLKRRGDAWKIALFTLIAFTVAAAIRPE